MIVDDVASSLKLLAGEVARRFEDQSQMRTLLQSVKERASAEDFAGVVDDLSTLVTQVQSARESMATYLLIERLRSKHYSKWPKEATFDSQMPGRFVIFVGYSRSGHSLVGSLLDAHPSVVIAHELHAVKHATRRTPLEQLVQAIKDNSYCFARHGRAYTGYNYQVTDQYQGSYKALRVVGDKKGNGTVRLLRRNPHLIGRLQEIFSIPVQFVHVIRNPLDNIATRARRKQISLGLAASQYFRNCKVIEELRGHDPGQFLDIYLEDLIERPKSEVLRALKGIGVRVCSDKYLEACEAVVMTRPSETRWRAKWNINTLDYIYDRMDQFKYLTRYQDTCQNMIDRFHEH